MFYTQKHPSFFNRYEYMFSPEELCFLCSCITKTRNLPGPILEVGCAMGNTTVFLNKHMDYSKIEKQYICIDTFSGFTQTDIKHEISRGKDLTILNTEFKMNSQKWFDRTMQINGISRVKSFQADIGQFEFKETKDISFCLIDVDLYIPVKLALEKTYKLMDNGGIIVVDDCWQNQIYDGAYQAYIEFVSTHNLPKKIVLGTLGVIEIEKNKDN